ncbi:Alpha/Beta hydrolase protein, partial [Xylogone sp. PMI_703]
DHIIGKPSLRFKRLQIITVLSFWAFYLSRERKHGKWPFARLSKWLSRRLTTFQAVNAALMITYLGYNIDKLSGIGYHEPLANLYSPSFFRATWVLVALDAGFWSAMPIRNKYLREICELLFTAYYLMAPDRADEKVAVRSCITVEHMRTAWNKPTTRYLSFVTNLLRPRYMSYSPRKITIQRPVNSTYDEPVTAWLYFDRDMSELREQRNVILDIPGGGFIAMTPRCNDDRLMAWAGQLGVPIISLDYKKAPEFPYPYALNECFDVYCALSRSRGQCIGLSGECHTRILISGDSAGGNLATALTLMIVEYNRSKKGIERLLSPEGLMLMYPALDFCVGSWMTDEEVELINSKNMRRITKSLIRRKSIYHDVLAGRDSPSDISESSGITLSQPAQMERLNTASSKLEIGDRIDTQLAVCSVISYTNDRIITPEMFRAMVILYVGPNHRPDLRKEYLLSPLVAPDELIADFPPTYFITGERDPLVDHTVLFAGKIRRAKANSTTAHNSSDRKFAEVHLIPGISHGFMQIAAVYPEAKLYFTKTATWIESIFQSNEYGHTDMATAPNETKLRLFNEAAVSGMFFGQRVGANLHTKEVKTHEEHFGDETDPLTSLKYTDLKYDSEREQIDQAGRHGNDMETVVQMSHKYSISMPDEDLLRRRMKELAAGLRSR